jgi:hypothetical protein
VIRDTIAGVIAGSTAAVASPPKVAAVGLTVILGAYIDALTGVLGGVLAVLFFSNIVLGTLKAVAEQGLGAFDEVKFLRGMGKAVAAVVIVGAMVAGDFLLHATGAPDSWWPLTVAGMTTMCYGFLSSTLVNAGYFFPEVKETVEAVVSKMRTDGRTND